MTNLEDIKNKLQVTIDTIDKAIEQESELYISFEGLTKNARASEIGGLKRPNIFPYINMLKMQKETFLTIKFHVECQIEDNKKF